MEFYLLLVGIAHYKGIANAQTEYMCLVNRISAAESHSSLGNSATVRIVASETISLTILEHHQNETLLRLWGDVNLTLRGIKRQE